MRNLSMAFLSLIFGISVLSVLAVDAKVLSSRCINCHGVAGMSANPLYPNLAGQKAAYLYKTNA